ncbi:hypothetical protein L3Q82_016514 [Scortum barcoo]|uniref:Uncharacterized protein n=1 Tax=Scortum barcoo TaxID=214431 RepID=A0ACB8X7F3_9TELE|nr:hypothetical protein L3Q82_016514 [Scortum barcoo]
MWVDCRLKLNKKSTDSINTGWRSPRSASYFQVQQYLQVFSPFFLNHVFGLLFEPPAATLSLHPDRSQFFRYDRFSLSCAAPRTDSGWTVKRNTSEETSQPCTAFGDPHESSCNVSNVYPSDSGLYWCESEQGECSNVVNITVTAGEVILESPALPVTAGDDVTLRCSTKKRYDKLSTLDFSAAFFRDDVFIGNETAEKMILRSVSKSEEGLYRCEHPRRGRSEQSWLSVRGDVMLCSLHTCMCVTGRQFERLQMFLCAQPPGVLPTSSPPPPLLSLPNLVSIILLFILYTVILIICIHMYRRWARVGR